MREGVAAEAEDPLDEESLLGAGPPLGIRPYTLPLRPYLACFPLPVPILLPALANLPATPLTLIM
jgi:hypothetical protein